MDMSLSRLWDIVKDREAWRTAVHGSQRIGHDLVTEQQQQIRPLCVSVTNTSSCAQRTVKPNNTETSESGADKGLWQEHARKMSGSCPPKISELPGLQ